MMTSILSILLILGIISNSLSQNTESSESESIDPDIKLCNDLVIDAAVKGDDGFDYVFKDQYYWLIDRNGKTLQESFAEPISSLWPDVIPPVDAAFTLVDDYGQWSTVFLSGKKWWMYKNKILSSSGSTTDWPYFPEQPIKAAFTYFGSPIEPGQNPIYFLYEENNVFHYAKYQIQDIKQMVHNITSKAFIRLRFFYFLESSEKTRQTLEIYLPKLSAVFTSQKTMLFFDEGQYCRADIKEVAPECQKAKNDVFFRCPRKARPTTTTTSTTTTTTPPTTTQSTTTTTTTPSTTTSTTIKPTTTSTTPTTSTTERRTTEIFIPTRPSAPPQVITYSTEPAVDKNKNDKNKKENGLLYVILFIIVVIVVVSIFMVICFVVSRKGRSSKTTVQPNRVDPMIRTESDSIKTMNSEKSGPVVVVQNEEPLESKSDSSLNTSMKKSKHKLRDDSGEPMLEKDTENSVKSVDLKGKDMEADQIIAKLKNSPD